jgi:enoyl-CoA hydratase/carnithine racemase
MLPEPEPLRLTADDGIATLWLEWPGERVNGWNPARLQQLRVRLERIAANPAWEILVLRSGRPDGFCDGFARDAFAALSCDSAAIQFARHGQAVLQTLADLPQVTVAFLEGPCLGPGWELALNCDYRLAQADPRSALGFGPEPTCWGGFTRAVQLVGQRHAQRLLQGPPLVAREAVRAGLVDHAFSARRAKIELRTWLDRLQHRPFKRPLGWRSWFANSEKWLAQERIEFRNAMRTFIPLPDPEPSPETINPIPPLPARIGMLGTSAPLANLGIELVLNGHRLDLIELPGLRSREQIERKLEAQLQRGRITPLEAEQARSRIAVHADANDLGSIGWFLCAAGVSAAPLESQLPPRAILCVPELELPRTTSLARRPERVCGFQLQPQGCVEVILSEETTADAQATVTSWFRQLGFSIAVRAETRESQEISTTSICRLV